MLASGASASAQTPPPEEPTPQPAVDTPPPAIESPTELPEAVTGPQWTDHHIDFGDPPTVWEERAVDNQLDAMGEPEASGQAAQGGDPQFTNPSFAVGANDYTIDYISSTGIPDAHRAVIDQTMEDWANAVDMNNGGINVQIQYVPMAGSALASTQHAFVILADGSTMPTALYNATLGYDRYPLDPDVLIVVNSNINWSTQLSGDIPSSQYSLYATMLHEIGHGLGFSSSFRPTSVASDVHTSFDKRLFFDVASGTGTAPSAPQRTINNPMVTTGQAWFLNLDGTWERIFDPTAAFQSGSSMSHFDEATYSGFTNAAGAVMTPIQYNGESSYEIDAVVLGAMEAAGWRIQVAPAPPIATTPVVTPDTLTVSVSPDTSTTHPPAAQWRVVVSQGSTVVSSATVSAADRAITVPGYLAAGTYTVTITGVGTGGVSSPAIFTVTSTNTAPPTYTNCRQAPVNPVFNTSNEVNASVYRLYCAYFLRYPDMDGFNFWFATFSNGTMTLDEISNFFAGGDEFGATYGSLTNDQFVELIYTNVLSRSPEPVGYAFWVDQLNTGGFTRGEVMLFFSQSDEFRILTGT